MEQLTKLCYIEWSFEMQKKFDGSCQPALTLQADMIRFFLATALRPLFHRAGSFIWSHLVTNIS